MYGDFLYIFINTYMIDDITRAICDSYKTMLNTGRASAKTGSDLRKVVRETDDSKIRENVAFVKAYVDNMTSINYDEAVEDSEKRNQQGFEKKIDETTMNIYLQKLK